MRVAALDDDVEELDLIKSTLRAIGHDCHVFTEGAALQRELRRETFDLLIFDWHLPDTTRPEIVQWVRNHLQARIPILFVTNRRQERDLVEGLAAGADDFMMKPIRVGELAARAIGNLLGNALKFSREGAWITCAVEALGVDWPVRVEDEGPGIDEALQAQLFEPCVRGRSGTQVDGAGLGLAFVRTVAQRHGGKVLLDSAPGRGSAFRLVLAQAPDAPPPERGQGEAPA
ncbi:hybrid sensor histidine kinase/response regulator [Variovorax sp. PBL-E5]|uniref:hybrid sensor histidine kinase/response regulator n=1 Tax=Variovorax sp. PBL-E5 TaxID=434014 RepID=UPI0013189D5C|nr:ATP-binding protein [Variovorax sp. PBL-E5]VTU38843.1 Alginate biosynthesis sensor protein KinB [Variovorax sp. PBL-E5]